VGQTIDYFYDVTNIGNVTLSNITVNDPHNGLLGLNCPDATLAVTATENCSATYVTTQADLTAGSIVNTATASGTPPGSTTPVVSPISMVTIPAVNIPAISILKQVCGSAISTDCRAGGAGPWLSSVSIPSGNTAFWRITVSNTGLVELTGVTITDAQAPQCVVSAGTFSLAIGGSHSVYCSTSDVSADFTNVAIATFTGQITPPPTSTATVAVIPPSSPPVTPPPVTILPVPTPPVTTQPVATQPVTTSPSGTTQSTPPASSTSIPVTAPSAFAPLAASGPAVTG
jgi:uncharacterized repeat protein (TIGR01451 family)